MIQRWGRISLILIVLAVVTATVLPAAYLLLKIDLSESLGLHEGFGERKYDAYELFLLISFVIALTLLGLIREKRVSWVLVGLTWTLCFVTARGARFATEAELAAQPLVALQRHTVIAPTIPSLLAVYSDKSWKKEIDDFSAFHEQAEIRRHRLEPDLQTAGLTPQESQIAAYMLFVSSLWEYGNAGEPDRVGCVCSNEDNGWVEIPKAELTAPTYANARIGCCTDYARILKRVLDDAKITNRLVSIPGHLLNEAMIHGRWYTVDANTNLFIDREWSKVGPPDGMRVFRFAHPGGLAGPAHRPMIPAFQADMLNRAIMGAPGSVKHPKLPRYIADSP